MKTIAIIALIIGTLFFLLGSVFKIMHWPGSLFVLFIGGALSLIGIVLLVVNEKKKNN
jgi:hypothetical protein